MLKTRAVFRRIGRWLQAIPISDPLRRKHAVTLQIFAIVLSVAVVGLEVGRFFGQGRVQVTAAINGANALLALVAVVLLRRGRFKPAALIFVIGPSAVLALAILLGGFQFSRDGIKSVAVGLTLAALLLGRRGLWISLAALAGATGIAFLRDLGRLGGTGPHQSPVSLAGAFWSSMATFAILAIILDRFGVTVQETLEQRRRAEKQLRSSEELFRVAFQTSPGAIAITRIDDRVIVAVNESFTRLTGWPQEEAVGRTAAEMNLWVDRGLRDRAANQLSNDGLVRDLEMPLRRRDGSEFVGTFLSQKFDLAGSPHVLTLMHDVTAERAAERERGLLQAQLLQAQKLESIGRVAGGVAHDLNNMLMAVLGYTDLLERSLTLARQKEDLEQIRLGGQRAVGLTRQLLSFARKQPIAPREIDLHALIRNLEGMLRRLAGDGVELGFDLSGGETPVQADAGQLEQVVVNLVVNARDAMAGRGKLTLATRPLRAPAVAGEHVSGLEHRDHAVLSVSDTGSGMTEDVLQHLFEPFFTTKEQGQGTGLGLATSYGIVKQAGGQFAVETKLGQGSTFRVYLPLVQGGRAPELPAPSSLEGKETVLVVEDDPQLRELAQRVLREHGYRVLLADDGLHGVELAEAHAGAIDLLLTDVKMPRLGGRELADRLRRTRPGLRVLYATGFAESAAELPDLLQKPFTAEALLQRVRQALDT
jgi:PAS domain S-box-containing protein